MHGALKNKWPSKEHVAAAHGELCRELVFLDSLVAIGEQADEIESYVNAAGRQAGILFFGWLMTRKLSHGAEVLASMVPFLFENVYLIENDRKRTLEKVSKKFLQEFLSLVEFAVDEKDWNRHVNPFDAVLLFYQFLDEIGYPASFPRRERAIRELRRKMLKHPLIAKQDGYDLVQ